MTRRFNTAGPNKPDLHYTLPPSDRLPGVRNIIDGQGYLVLHAPRQSGKTTALLALAAELTAGGSYAAVLVSAEVGAAFPGDPGAAEAAMLDAWEDRARDRLPPDLRPPPWPPAAPGQRVGRALAAWCRAVPRPLVVFLDEIDALRDDALVSVLRQLRDGYPARPVGFPWSVALVGLRDVRDYKVASGGSDRLGSPSPFNITAESVTLGDFTVDEVAALYGQHTAETGQVFSPGAVARAWDLTRGQPWLVNALARQAVEVCAPDPASPVTADVVDQARDRIVQRQDTHLDSLAERLREPRVRQVLEPVLAGAALPDLLPDDVRYVLDLGLVRRPEDGGIEIANPIYREVIVRSLAAGARDSLPRFPATWLTAEGRLDAGRLLETFMAFWRQHGEPLMRATHYTEVAPHLVLMAFLHRVTNGGGTVEREYAIGTGRMDVLVKLGADVLAMELKVWRDGEPDPRAEGLAQLDGYLSGLGLGQGWLVVFDRRAGLARLADRTTSERAATPGGRDVVVLRA